METYLTTLLVLSAITTAAVLALLFGLKKTLIIEEKILAIERKILDIEEKISKMLESKEEK